MKWGCFDRAALTVAPASQHYLYKPAKLRCRTQFAQVIAFLSSVASLRLIHLQQSWHPRQQQQRRNQHPPRRQSRRNPPVVARRALRRLWRATRSTSTRYITWQPCEVVRSSSVGTELVSSCSTNFLNFVVAGLEASSPRHWNLFQGHVNPKFVYC